jgi:ribosomal protein S18 acetylase RimI-like enzyme
MYEDIHTKKITTAEEYAQAWCVMYEEFPDHRDTDLIQEYKWILIATKKSKVVGVITANKYIPKKALLCDIVVKPEYRSQGVAIKLLKHMGMLLQEQGYTHLLGFTPKKNREALNTYKRVHTKQEEMIVTTSDLSISVPHIEQMENTIKYREERNKKHSKR